MTDRNVPQSGHFFIAISVCKSGLNSLVIVAILQDATAEMLLEYIFVLRQDLE